MRGRDSLDFEQGAVLAQDPVRRLAAAGPGLAGLGVLVFGGSALLPSGFQGKTCCAVKPNSRTSSCTDRKSTRLNSSHLVISYAVFCLKKKKINTLTVLLTL